MDLAVIQGFELSINAFAQAITLANHFVQQVNCSRSSINQLQSSDT